MYYIKKAMKRTSSCYKSVTESSRRMRGTIRDISEYILELHPEALVGRDVVAYVIVLKYLYKILAEAVIVR